MHPEIKGSQKKKQAHCHYCVLGILGFVRMGVTEDSPESGNPRRCLSPPRLSLLPGLQNPCLPTKKLSSLALGGGEGPEISPVSIPAFLGRVETLPFESKGCFRLPAHQ